MFEVKLKKHVVNPQAIRPSGISTENGSKVEERKSMGKKSQLSANSGRSSQNGANRTSGERYTSESLLINIFPMLFLYFY